MNQNSCLSYYVVAYRPRPCPPRFISGRENSQEKPPPRITTVFSRNHPPARGGFFPVPLHRGYSQPILWPSCEGNYFTRSQSGFRSKLKLHFQKRISARKSSTCEKNQQLRNNFWEVAATSNHPAATFRVKATTLLQNKVNTRLKPLLWHKKIFML